VESFESLVLFETYTQMRPTWRHSCYRRLGVESVGEGVQNVKPSDRVAFTGMPGAYSEAILADADRLIPLPSEFTFEEGAAFPLQG
jgi:hypothetical protein